LLMPLKKNNFQYPTLNSQCPGIYLGVGNSALDIGHFLNPNKIISIIHLPSSISHHPFPIIHLPSSISHHPSSIIHLSSILYFNYKLV